MTLYLNKLSRTIVTRIVNYLISMFRGVFVSNDSLYFWGGSNDDNIMALAKEFSECTIFVILNPNEKIPRWSEHFSNVRYLDNSLFSITKCIFSSKVVFFTHGFFNGVRLSKKQRLVNLWHGMPIKCIGEMSDSTSYGDRVKPTFDLTFSTHEKYSRALSEAFSCDIDHAKVTGSPRNDVFTSNDFGFMKHYVDEFLSKIDVTSGFFAIWLPTYRCSTNGEQRQDGSKFRLSLDFWCKINHALCEKNITLLIKAHPMDSFILEPDRSFSHIRFITDEDLVNNSVTLYSLLRYSQFLVSDVSSVVIDYMLISKEIILFFPDFEKYKLNRGIYDLDLYNYISVIDDEFDFIKYIVDNEFEKGEKYNISDYHKYSCSFSRRAKDYINLGRIL